MSPIASSSMGLFRFSFCLLLIICCVITVKSFTIDHRPFEDRHQRAVTEWRFRRNFLVPMPYVYPNYMNTRMIDNEEVENENVPRVYHTKYIPNIIYDQSK